jgi:hypothetical protein
MPGVDLSDYAGLFIFGIFAINVVIAVLGYKMNGKESAIASGTLAFLGMWIGLGIVKTMDFDDATPETVITIGVFSTLFSIIYIIYVFTKWLDKRKLLKLQQKQNYYQNELEKLEQEIVDRNHIYHLIQLINCCGCNTVYFEKHNELSDMSRITDEIKKKKAQLNDISSQIMAGRNLK